MALHRNLVLDDIHALGARIYADIAARDADSAFNTAVANINKVVRVESPLSYYILTAITPAWLEFTNTTTDEWIELSDTPGSISAGLSVQGNAGGTALEFGQALRTADSPQFVGLTITGDLTVQGITTTLLVEDKNIELGVVPTPTDVTADGGGITLKGATDKTILWDNITDAWTFNQDIDALANIIKTTGVVTGGFVIGITSVFGGNLLLSGNTLSSSNANGDITLAPNGSGNVVISGDLTVQGTTTTIDSTTLLVEDKNIELGVVTTPTDVTADGGGITLKGTTDKTINWLSAKNAWEFNQSIDLLGNNLIAAGTITAARAFFDNVGFDNNAIFSLAGDLDVTTQSGGVFKFTVNAIRAGLDAVEYVEMGHGGGSGFINLVGDPGLDIRFEGVTKATFTDNSLRVGLDATNLLEIGHGGANAFIIAFGAGGLDFRFEGTTKATFTEFGHLHLLTDVDQKHTLKIVTANNLNDTGIAWENSGGSFTHTIFRTDVGSNRADLIFAAGQNTNIDLLTNSFKIHGGAGVEGKLEILGALQISSGGPGLDKVLTSDATGLATWQENLGTFVAQETFASTNVRFFGELALPVAQGWTDTATGPATIDLVTQIVFGESKQVVRHNDDTGTGSTTSQITLTTQNWIDINAFGASYSGTERLDSVDGGSGFFSGLQANAAENPLATGNRRYGVLFDNIAGNLRVFEADNTGNSVIMDGTGGNPAVLFDEWFNWECVVPAGLGAAEFYINGILTTFVPVFGINGGGLGTRVLVSSGSTGGSNRIVYHDNFGVTIFEEATTKTLAVATMAADIAQVNIPEGKRDYTIILPDGNPRPIGSVLRLVANNLFGKITLENQNPAAPEILYNGLRTLVIDVFVKEIIGGINTVDQGNVYLGFKDEDIDRAESIFAQLSSSVDQVPVDTNPTVITYNTQDEINGIGHSTSLNPGELEILPGFGGVYFVSPQPQVGKDTGGVKTDFDMFWEIDRGSGFVDEPNSNVRITIKDNEITTTASSAFTITLNVGDKIRMLQRVSNSTVGLGLKNTDPEVGPPTVPRTPSIILTVHRVGGI